MPVTVEPLEAPSSALGEGPVWDPATATLRWIDIHRALLHTWTETAGWTGAVALPATPGFLLRAPGDDLLIGMRTGVFRTRPPFERFVPLTHPNAAAAAGSRYNDAATDPAGRVWAGTVESAPGKLDGALYRIDVDGGVHLFLEGLAVPNGMGFSPDQRTMYLTITERSRILAYDYDPASGDATNGRDFVVDDRGLPDGLVVDRDGGVWSAKWAGDRIAHYDPSGDLIEEIALPVHNVTSLVFGGPGLGTLFVTTAEDDDPEHPSADPAVAGVVFRLEGTGVHGIPDVAARIPAPPPPAPASDPDDQENQP